MSLITEKRDVQDRIINYLISIGWDYLPPSEILTLRDNHIKEPFLVPVVKEKLKKLNKGIITDQNVDDVIRRLKLLHANLHGNEEFLNYLRNQKTIYFAKEKRERNIELIDYENPENNSFIFTQEFEFQDKDKRRTDIVLFINGFAIGIVENKSPTLEQAQEEAFDQIKNIYNQMLPELFKYLQFYVACDGIHIHYGPTWNYESKTFYRWKARNGYKLENLTKSFFDKGEILRTLRDYLVFLRIDEELQKYILTSHQRRAIQKIIKRVLDEKKNTGLIWHTQGSYKTLTMIVSASKLRQALKNPTILVVLDRLELEGQIHQNFEAFGFPSTVRAKSKKDLRELLSSDHRGLIITTIQKFEGMPKHINTRDNIIVLIDEAHRSQERDLGNYMRGALPNAYYFGFTGTPVDKTRIGRGTFVTFGSHDRPKGYLDKYSIDESIDDKTTVPLYYTLARTDLHVDKEILEKEFFEVVEREGIASLEELNKIIEKAEKLKAVLKSHDRIDKISKYIADHYRKSVEPLGFKAFIVAVDREACALYKQAIDKYLQPKYTRVVYTKAHKDSELLRRYHINEDKEKNIRKAFKSPGQMPKILIVTEKLLTGYDAPILYVMYLDKPFKDHTLLQAIARVNRPYEEKTCGLIVDFIGIFENLQKALAFDSKDVSRGLIDIKMLKERFKVLMKQAKKTLADIDVRDEEGRVARIIDYFFDEEKRAAFVKMFKEIQEIYEILSPDEFLRDYISDYQLVVGVYKIVHNTFNPEAERKRIHREILRKTEELIKETVELRTITDSLPVYEINRDIANLIRADNLPERVKVVNLHRSLVLYIQRNEEKQPFLIPISERVEEIISQLRERQKTVESALKDLTGLAQQITSSREEQKRSGLGREEFSIFWILRSYKIDKPEEMAKRIYSEMEKNKEWFYNEKIEGKLRMELYKLLLQLRKSGVIEEIGAYETRNLSEIVGNVLKMHRILAEGK